MGWTLSPAPCVLVLPQHFRGRHRVVSGPCGIGPFHILLSWRRWPAHVYWLHSPPDVSTSETPPPPPNPYLSWLNDAFDPVLTHFSKIFIRHNWLYFSLDDWEITASLLFLLFDISPRISFFSLIRSWVGVWGCVNRPRDALEWSFNLITHVPTLSLSTSSATFQERQDPHSPGGGDLLPLELQNMHPWGADWHSGNAWICGTSPPYWMGESYKWDAWHTRDDSHSVHYPEWYIGPLILQWVPSAPQGYWSYDTQCYHGTLLYIVWRSYRFELIQSNNINVIL